MVREEEDECSQASWCYDPFLEWDEGVYEYLSKAFGRERLTAITKALCHPSKTSCLRVNTLTTTSQEVIKRLEHECALQGRATDLEGKAAFRCWEHDLVPGVVTVEGSGPNRVDYTDAEGRPLREVLVSRKCGEAVLRGADAFVPGILASEPGINAGDDVAVSMSVESCAPPPTRGTTLGSSHDASSPSRNRWFIGCGRALLSRAAIFRQEQGVAVEMTQSVYSHPSLYELTTRWADGVFLQHLPSVIAAHVLDPKPGERILDMCASPGGKTTAIAILMKNRGEIVALDRSQIKVQQIKTLAAQMGLTCIQAFKMDATACARQDPVPNSAACSADGGAEELGNGILEQFETGNGERPFEGLPNQCEPSKAGAFQGGDTADGAELSSNDVAGHAKTRETPGSVSRTGGLRISDSARDGTAGDGECVNGTASGRTPLSSTQAPRRGFEQTDSPTTVETGRASYKRPECVADGGTTAGRDQSTSAPGIAEGHMEASRTEDSQTEDSRRGETSFKERPCSNHTELETPTVLTATPPFDPEPGPSTEGEPDSIIPKPPNARPSKPSTENADLGRRGTTLERRARRKEARWLRSNQKRAKPDKLEPGSFDRVLVDAPCSALGLRPRLFVAGVTLQSLRQDGVYKRRFLDQAVRLVKPGGVIVYSTCTINPGENEALVRYALDTYPCLRLVPQEPRLGGPGLVGGDDVFDGTGYREWLRHGEQNLVQRFDPDGPLDTIGFFIAKFEKLLPEPSSTA